MWYSARCLTAAAILLMSLPASMASEEEFVPWQSVSVESPDRLEAGKVALQASAKDDAISSLKVTAFGRTHSLAPAELAKLNGFPLSSLRITEEAGYKELGGHMVHFRFQRTSYDSERKEVFAETAIISMAKEKKAEPVVAVTSKATK